MIQATTKDRFKKAVECLVDEAGPIKERMLIAYASQLSSIDPMVELPPEMIEEFAGIQISIGQDQVPGDKGNAASQLVKLSDTETMEIAKTVFSLFCRLHGIE